MPLVLVYTRKEDGGVSVVNPWVRLPDAPDGSEVFNMNPPNRGTDTEEQYVMRMCMRSVPVGAINIGIVKSESLLPMRRWRNAWTNSNNLVQIDFAKAKEIRKQELMALKMAKLQKYNQDVEVAIDNEDKAAEKLARDKRKQVRDLNIDSHIEIAKNLMDLHNLMPAPLM